MPDTQVGLGIHQKQNRQNYVNLKALANILMGLVGRQGRGIRQVDSG